MDLGRLKYMFVSKNATEPINAGSRTIIPSDAHEDVAEYFESLLPASTYFASGVRVKTLQGISDENAPEVAPGGFIAPHGYLVIATSIGGNGICVEIASGRTYWADRSSFSEDCISYKDRETGEWIDLPFTSENIAKALVPIEVKLQTFIEKLLSDQLEKLFDELD